VADPERPTPARVYDYLLGGAANGPADRRFGDELLNKFPQLRSVVVANRLFLHRAVRHLVRLGIRQFIDIGAGVPTMGATHSVADEVAPGATRVVYVDHDPVAVDHSRMLIEEHGDPRRHAIVAADLREPDRLWRDARATGLIEPTEPIGLLLIAVLHLKQPDSGGVDIGPRAVARYRELLPGGSYLALSHATSEGGPGGLRSALGGVRRLYESSTAPVSPRSRAEIAALFGDFELVSPGLVWAPLWRPEESAPDADFPRPAESIVLAGVGRKTG
jgi:hypothetical protein